VSDSGTNISGIVGTAEEVIDAAGTILSALLPGGMIGSFTISQIVAILNGIASGVPEIVAAYNDIKAAVDGQAAPTGEELAALQASVDAEDNVIQADAAEIGGAKNP